LFAGIGSQHQALKNLGVKIDRSTIVEWQVNSIQAYNDIHIRKYNDHTQGLTKEDLAKRLSDYGMSIDYNQPAKIETLMRKGEEWLRNVYNNIINTNNKVNIMSVKGKDLQITETNKYDYILTYSFPCQDLSKAGKGKGMSNTTTRSGLLWEVERILSELNELPQVLLMENVPDVIGSKFISDFQRWESRLRELGYSNHTEILNSKDFGIPQNRERAFMVSILGSSLYNFPQKQPLTLRLKDMLEKEVDEKYYLTDTFIAAMNKPSKGFNRAERFEQSIHTNLDTIAFTVTSKAGSRPTDNFIDETKEYANYITWLDDKGRLNTQDHRAYFEDRLSGTIPAMERGVPNVLLNGENNNLTTKETIIYDDYHSKIREDQDTIGTLTTNIGNNALRNSYKLIEKQNDLRIRKLTPKECYRLMGFGDEVFDLAQPNQSNSSLYHQAGDSIVVNVLMELFRSLI
jgi:DNA (cytosine-5)-methyltransferase 1